jgi:hypothetical protein
MLWWHPEHGEAFGYRDGWADGAFYFSGMGQKDSQQFGGRTPENGRVRDHVRNGERLRLLRYLQKNLVRYSCELRLDPVTPYAMLDAPDLYGGGTRQIIQFRLLPVGPVFPDDLAVEREPRLTSVAVEDVPQLPPPVVTRVEKMNEAAFQRLVAAHTRSVERVESLVVHEFSGWLMRERGLHTSGRAIPYDPECRNLRVDLFVDEPYVLVEAKARPTRENLRTAIGQLLDYARFLDPRPALCVLTPSRPPDDMLELLRSLSIDAVWREGTAFEGTPAWLHA